MFKIKGGNLKMKLAAQKIDRHFRHQPVTLLIGVKPVLHIKFSESLAVFTQKGVIEVKAGNVAFPG